MDDNQNVMTEILAKQGHSDSEIQRLLIRLRDYDNRTIRDSVFHSIADGSFRITGNDTATNEENIHDTAS